jgi:hypothetical protein
MSNEAPAGRARTPVHLWILGIVALLWNGFGAFDFTMTQTRNMEYLKMYTPEQLAYVLGWPLWAVAAWGVGVWGGVVGALLLLVRKRLAAPLFLASLVGAVVGHAYSFASGGIEMAGGGAMAIFPVVIVLIAVGLWLYARAMAKKGVLA